jgi:hypothetical protein
VLKDWMKFCTAASLSIVCTSSEVTLELERLLFRSSLQICIGRAAPGNRKGAPRLLARGF